MRPGNIQTMIIVMGIAVFTLNTSLANPQPQLWTAPDSADSLVNPLKKMPKAWKKGAALYNTACVVCHGNRGWGDGIAGAALKPRPADLTSKLVQEQSDGAIFWKLTEGNSPMASYKAIYTDEQRWQLVEYIRQLKD